MQKLQKGILITLEGIDGSGKSTLAHSLFKQLQAEQHAVLLTREPGASQLGQELRILLQTQRIPLCPKAQMLLFAADRAQHIQDIVQPHLQQGYVVLSDRMSDSSIAYQVYGNGLERDMIDQLNAWTMQQIKPDAVLYVHIPVRTALERIAQRGNATAYEKEHFLHKVYAGYEDLYRSRTDVTRIDGTQSPHDVFTHAYKKIQECIQRP